jgi:hypothetical protein
VTLLLFCAVFALGVGILVAGAIGVMWIWGRRHPEPESEAVPKFYAGIPLRESSLVEPGTVLVVDQGAILGGITNIGFLDDHQPRLYDWKTREPMIWGSS